MSNNPVLAAPGVSVDLPLTMSASGPQPTAPATIRALLTSIVASQVPGYTNTLPGGLIEDIASTIISAVALMDQARIDLINSVSPYGANAFILTALGQIYGVPLGIGSNATVDVRFTATDVNENPLAGFVIPQGTLVSDGTNQYIVQEGTVTAGSGIAPLVTALATQFAVFPIPANSVTQILTQVPANIELSVTNPQAGFQATTPLDATAYRAQVLQAGLASSQGMARYLKTLLGNVPGVQSNLVSVRQQPGGWEIIVGGGDEDAVANAIWQSLFDISTLVGSTINVTAFTAANPGVVTTDLNHGLVNGQTITVADAAPNEYNGRYVVTVISPTSFSVGTNTSSFPTYLSGGIIVENARNAPVSINDYPDIYTIPIVRPPQQNVTMVVTWNTTATDFTSGPAVAQLAPSAIAASVNSIAVGQPIIIFLLEAAFRDAVATVLPPYLTTRLVFAVTIDGHSAVPVSGTGAIFGDPESYYFCRDVNITVVQG